MSVEIVPGGQRRIDRVLDPRFTDGVERLDLAELRSRREEAEAEEADVSYLRRLLQGRLDILRAELERRSAGGDQDVAGLLAGLPAILTDDAPGTFSAVPRFQLPSRAGEHRRRVERLISDETIARLPELDVEELTRAVEVLSAEEEKVSTHRRTVQRVVDRSVASWPAATGTAPRRCRSFSSDLLDLLEGLKSGWLWSDGYSDGAEPCAHRRRRPRHQAGRLRVARPGRVRPARGGRRPGRPRGGQGRAARSGHPRPHHAEAGRAAGLPGAALGPRAGRDPGAGPDRA